MQLSREIRFSVPPQQEGTSERREITNSWGGWPSAAGIWPYLVLRATVRGEIDSRTGFLCNVRQIDRTLRDIAVPLAGRLLAEQGGRLIGEVLLTAIWDALVPRWSAEPLLTGLQLLTTPFLRFERQDEVPKMIFVTQSFEFSASHRLCNPQFSEHRNWEVFGKCNNPSGHGHNYVVDVTVKGEPGPGGRLMPLTDLERVVGQRVVERFDHKHLNADCPEFAELNPTVENITRVIWSLLDGQFGPAQLHRVRVWETPKTYAEYLGPQER